MLETLKNIGNKVLIKEKNILLKKIYLPPRVAFEEIEEDELDMLMAGSDTTGGSGDLQPGKGSQEDPEEENSLDIDFSMDFVINDEPKI